MIVGYVEMVVVGARRTCIGLGRGVKVGVGGREVFVVELSCLYKTHWSPGIYHFVESLDGFPVALAPPCAAVFAIFAACWPGRGSEGDVGVIDQWSEEID